MNHDDLKDLVPLHALDALEGAEKQELSAHLRSCAECARLLEEHQDTASMLALAAGSMPASAELKQRVVAQAGRGAQVRSIQRDALPAPSSSWSLGWRGLAAAAAFLIVLAASGLVYQQLSESGRLVDEQQTIIARQQEALDVMTAPDAIVLPMSPTDSGAGLEGRVFVSDARDAAAVVLSGLQDPGPEVYTLWLIAEGDRKPVADFLPADGRALVAVDDPVGSEVTLAVTREPRRGNSSPEGPVLLTAYRA